MRGNCLRKVFFAAAVGAVLGPFFVSSASVANPGCSADDVANAVSSTVSNFNSACLSEFGDFAFYGLTGALGATAAAGASSQVDQGCSSVQDALQQVASGAKSLDDLKGQLDSLGPIGAAIKQFLKDEAGVDVDDPNSDPKKLAAALSGALQPLTCACNVVTNPGISQLGNDLGSCLSDGLDYLDCKLLGNCPPEPTPPTQITCTPDGPCPRDENGYYHCDINAPVVGGTVDWDWSSPTPAFACTGDICSGGNNWCYCPKYMQQADRWLSDPWDGVGISYLKCACPDGHPLGTGNLAYICVCDNGQHVGEDGFCPPPPPPCNPSCPNNQIVAISDKNTCTFSCGCSAGQTNLGDRCVTPCADPGKVLLANGSCCAPEQATSCGTCCPAGMKPDPATGSCAVPSIPSNAPPQFPKQPQPPRKL